MSKLITRWSWNIVGRETKYHEKYYPGGQVNVSLLSSFSSTQYSYLTTCLDRLPDVGGRHCDWTTCLAGRFDLISGNGYGPRTFPLGRPDRVGVGRGRVSEGGDSSYYSCFCSNCTYSLVIVASVWYTSGSTPPGNSTTNDGGTSPWGGLKSTGYLTEHGDVMVQSVW